jgi:hypothetical protein
MWSSSRCSPGSILVSSRQAARLLARRAGDTPGRLLLLLVIADHATSKVLERSFKQARTSDLLYLMQRGPSAIHFGPSPLCLQISTHASLTANSPANCLVVYSWSGAALLFSKSAAI